MEWTQNLYGMGSMSPGPQCDSACRVAGMRPHTNAAYMAPAGKPRFGNNMSASPVPPPCFEICCSQSCGSGPPLLARAAQRIQFPGNQNHFQLVKAAAVQQGHSLELRQSARMLTACVCYSGKRFRPTVKQSQEFGPAKYMPTLPRGVSTWH